MWCSKCFMIDDGQVGSSKLSANEEAIKKGKENALLVKLSLQPLFLCFLEMFATICVTCNAIDLHPLRRIYLHYRNACIYRLLPYMSSNLSNNCSLHLVKIKRLRSRYGVFCFGLLSFESRMRQAPRLIYNMYVPGP